MLHSIVEGRDHLIEQEDVVEGIKIANAAIEALFLCMKNLEVVCSTDKWVKNMARAEIFLSENASTNAVSKTDIYKYIKHISKRDMDNIITTLKDSGRIKTESGPNGALKVQWMPRC
jgi:hypothetical protein